MLPVLWRSWFPIQSTLLSIDNGAYFSYGPLALIIAALATWYVRRQHLSSASLPTQSTSALYRWDESCNAWVSALGAITMALIVLFLVAGVLLSSVFFCGLGSIALLASTCVVRGGLSQLFRYRFPIFWLMFAVPLPVSLTDMMNEFIKMKVAGAAVWISNFTFHVPVLQDGRLLFLQGIAPHDPHVMVVANVCGGLRSMLALTFVAALLVGICRLRSPARWLLLLAAPPIAIFFNGLRFTALILLASGGHMETEGTVQWMHQATGLAAFIGSLMMLIQFEYVLPRWAAMLRFELHGEPAIDLAHVSTSVRKRKRRSHPSVPAAPHHHRFQLVFSAPDQPDDDTNTSTPS